MVNIIRVSKGSSLIEVMVALFVLAIGLLGVLAMQARSVQLNQSAYLYSQAAILANDIMEAMRTSKSAAGSYLLGYDDPTPGQPNCITAGIDCSEDQIASWNVYQWRTNIENLLPGGEGEIERIGDEFVIKVRFQVGYDEDTDEAVTDHIQLSTGL